MNVHLIIVNFNAGDWLKRSLESALESSKAEITVVDNASSDDSVRIARSAFDSSRVSWIENDTNLGFAAANNQALQSGLDQEPPVDYFVLMNPDCELRDSTLSLVLKEFEENQRLGLASCLIRNEDGSVQATSRRRFPTPLSSLWQLSGLAHLFPGVLPINLGDQGLISGLEKVESISGAFMIVRTEALTEVGLLDEGYFMHCEDLDWCKRFAAAGWIVGFVSDAEIIHAKGVSSHSRPVGVLWTMHKGMHRYFSKFYKDSTNPVLYYTVIFGIYLSFAPRAVLSKLKSLWKVKRK